MERLRGELSVLSLESPVLVLQVDSLALQVGDFARVLTAALVSVVHSRFQFGDEDFRIIERDFVCAVVAASKCLRFQIVYLLFQGDDLVSSSLRLPLEFDVLPLLLFELFAHAAYLDISDLEPFLPLFQMKLEAVDFLLGRFDSVGHCLQLFYLGCQRVDLLIRFGQLLPPFLAVALRAQKAEVNLGMLVLPFLDFNRRGFQFTFEPLDFGLRMPPLTVAMARLVLRGLQLRLELLAFLTAPFARRLRLVFYLTLAEIALLPFVRFLLQVLHLDFEPFDAGLPFLEFLFQLFDAPWCSVSEILELADLRLQLGECLTRVQTGSLCFRLI